MHASSFLTICNSFGNHALSIVERMNFVTVGGFGCLYLQFITFAGHVFLSHCCTLKQLFCLCHNIEADRIGNDSIFTYNPKLIGFRIFFHVSLPVEDWHKAGEWSSEDYLFHSFLLWDINHFLDCKLHIF